jgi:hypothetical protein
MNGKKQRKIKAWLVTFADNANSKEVVAILNPRLSGERVRDLLEFLWITKYSALSEQLDYAVDKRRNPYRAEFGALGGVPWTGQVHCGLNPSLFARLVDDLAVDRDEHGKETATWKERPKPDQHWKRGASSHE